MIKKFNILFCFLLSSSFYFSQYQVKNFFSVTGKKDVPINVIAQDHSAFLWLGTNEGLFKFDGRTTDEISKNFPVLKQKISAIFFDQLDKIWIGTNSGRVYTIFKNKLDSVSLDTSLQLAKITSFCEIQNKLIISTYGNGIFIYSKGKLDQLNTKSGLSDDIVYKTLSDKTNLVWCATDAGISEISFTKSTPSIHILSDKNGLPDNIVRDISINKDQLLISMQDSGLCFYNYSKRRFDKNPFFSNWSMGTVLNASYDPSGEMIIATEKNGMLIVKNSLLSVYEYTAQIKTNSISQMFVDREHQIWLASQKGISQFTERRYQFIDKTMGIEDPKILAIAIGNDQTIWIGTSNGVSKLIKDEKGNTFIQEIPELKKYTISCAAKAPDGDIWFGTYGQGIIVLSAKTNKSVILNTNDDEISDNNICNIYFEDEHNLYISTLGGGLIKATVDLNGEYKLFNIDRTFTKADGLGSNYVYSAIAGIQSKLFVATDGGGLQVFENNKFTDITKKFKLLSNTIFSLCRDKFGNIWAISNEDGIIKYDGKSITKFNEKNGLRESQPLQIICSDEHVFSIHSKGIDKIDCKNGHISYYDISIDELEPNLNAVVYYENKIYSGTNSGILILRTSRESRDSILPKIYLKSFRLNYKPFPIDSIYEYSYNQNNFGFTFDGIWLKDPSKLKYRFRLEGWESGWNYSNEGQQVNYNNIDPGTYTFIAQVQNEEEIWSEPLAYSLTVKTPFWKRWWFWLITISGLAFGIYSYLRYRLRILQREKLILEVKVKERTAQIEKQSKIIEDKNIELEQLSLVASKTDNAVLILDSKGNVEYVNDSFTRLHGMELDEFIMKHGRTIYELSNHPQIREILNDAISNKKSVNYESLNKKIGTEKEVWQSSTLTPIFDNAGDLKKIIIIDTDVSERKKQEQIIIQKNKDITDSISYARKIQYSILPQESLMKSFLPDLSLVYLTKDIVSGDFYWFTHIQGSSIIAAVDCTGHGVPGAFMSLIGYNLLNKIVNEDKITDPKDILFALNQGVINALYKNETESKDGMDIAICKINHDQNTLEYAGAMRPLWVLENNILTEIKADKIPIGTKQKDREENIQYTTHSFLLNGERNFYIFTDGYADQFGGPKEKKYSTGRFKELLIGLHALDHTKQAEMIKSEHIQWKQSLEQVDDILVIGFKI